MLLDPFGTRFAFHFYGDRKTNDIWKPQWLVLLMCYAFAYKPHASLGPLGHSSSPQEWVISL